MVKDVLRNLTYTGWGYLIKQFPVRLDDKLPIIDKVNLDKHSTFSFANAYYVAFSESRALQQITNYYSENNLSLTYSELERNVENVLMHEYGHILLEHVFSKPMKTEFDSNVQIYTAEIETNRGVPKPLRGKYFDDVIISDDKQDFATVKPYVTHKAVFDEVKRILKNKEQEQKKQENQKDDQKSGGNGDDKQDNEQKNDSHTPSRSQSEKNSEQSNKPDQVGTMAQAMRDASKNDDAPQADLLSELGLQHSEDFKNADINERLRILTELQQNNDIKKTLSRIKGTLAGELSKEKVGTYSRPSRKTGEDGIMRRGSKRGATKRPNILIALDESGSMDGTAVQTAATAVKLISKTIGRNRSDIKICSFNSSIDKVAKLGNYDYVVDTYHPRGGTSFYSVVELAKRNNCDVVLCIGDGEDILPNDCGNIKWIDVLITPYGQVERIENIAYTDLDKKLGRRETLWLGNNKRRIEQFASDM